MTVKGKKVQCIGFWKWCSTTVHADHSWQRVPNPPILWRLPIMPTPLFKFCPTPTFAVASNLHPHCSFQLSYFFGWMGDYATFGVPLIAIMDLHMSNLGTLVPEGPCYVFYATRCQVYWGLWHMFFCWYSDLISHTSHINTYTQTHIAYILYTICYVLITVTDLRVTIFSMHDPSFSAKSEL